MNGSLSDIAPIVTQAAPALSIGPNEVRILGGIDTGAPIGAIDFVIAPGFAPPPVLHRHTQEDAGWFVLEGDIEFSFADGTSVRAGPGDTIIHAKGCWFRWANADSQRPARAICWYTPAGFEQFFVDLAEAAQPHFAAGGTMKTFAPTLAEIRARYGDEQHTTVKM